MPAKTIRVEHYFDFGSPNCYFAHRAIPAIQSRTGAEFVYLPMLLGGVFKATNNQPPLVAFKDVANKLAYERLEIDRFIRRHHLDRFKMNPFFPVNTVLLMRGITALQGDSAYAPTIEALFSLMWEDGVKLDDPALVARALDERGLNGEAFVASADRPEIKAMLRTNTDRAVARGVFGAPTFFVGEAIYFGKDRLRDVEEAIVAAAA